MGVDLLVRRTRHLVRRIRRTSLLQAMAINLSSLATRLCKIRVWLLRGYFGHPVGRHPKNFGTAAAICATFLAVSAYLDVTGHYRDGIGAVPLCV